MIQLPLKTAVYTMSATDATSEKADTKSLCCLEADDH